MPSTNTTAAKTPKTPKPRMTAEERRAKREAERLAAEQEREAARLAFEAERPLRWLELFTKALRIEVVKASSAYSEVIERQDYWFGYFRVDARKQSFSLEEMGSARLTQESLHPSDVERINSALDWALQWFDEYDAEQERLRKEAEELARRRKEAKDKLSDEDLAALGLRR